MSNTIILNNSELIKENMYKFEINNFWSNIIRDFAIFFCTLGTACIISTALIGISQKYDEEMLENDTDENSVKEEIFKYKYLETYNELELNDLEENFNNNYIEEKTPLGIVAMSYDKESEIFIYYSDNKNIPYYDLETVARLFVIKNNCKKIYIDYQEEVEKAIKVYHETLEKKKKMEEELKTNSNSNSNGGVFALFKRNIEQNQNINLETKEGNILDKNKIIPEKLNRYKYKGKISEYNEYLNNVKIIEEKNKNIDEFEDLDYNTFKNIKYR